MSATVARPSALPRRAGLAAGWGGFVSAALLVLAAWGLRLAIGAASGASLHVDEAQYWDWSRALQWGYFSKPPLIAALIALSTLLFGDSESGLRAVPLLCWPLAAAALARLVGAMAHHEGRPLNAGIWAAAVFIASPLAGLLGLVATTDGPLLLCWVLALWAAWAAVVERRARAWLGCGLALGLGLQAKYSAAALLPGLWLFVALRGSRGDGLRVAGSSLLALLLLAPNLLWNQAQGWPTLQHTAAITLAAASRPTVAASLISLLAFVLGQWLCLAPLLSLLGWHSLRRWLHSGQRGPWQRQRDAALLLGTTSLPLLGAGLLQAWHAGVQLNWVAPLHLAGAAVLGLWLAAQARAVQRQAACVLALQALLVGLLALAPGAARAGGGTWPAQLDLWARMRGWPQAFERLAPVLQSRPGLPVVATTRAAAAQAAYQWRRLPFERAAWRAGALAQNHYQMRCGWQPGDGAALLLSEGAPPVVLLQPGALPLASATRPGAAAGTGSLQLTFVPAAQAAASTAGRRFVACR